MGERGKKEGGGEGKGREKETRGEAGQGRKQGERSSVRRLRRGQEHGRKE